MARTRLSAKKAGTAFETSLCTFLSSRLGKAIVRMPKSGAADKGDIHGVTVFGDPIAIECKNPGEKSAWSVAGWWKETQAEAVNIGTLLGVLVVKQFRQPVEKSLCICDEQMFEHITSQRSELTVMEAKSVPFAQWSELVAPGTVLKTPRRGTDGHWMVCTVDDFCEFFDARSKADVLILDKDTQKLLLEGKEVYAPTCEGTEIRVRFE